MCLIVFAWQHHPRYRLVLVANRDERYARPAAPLCWWPDQPQLLAGRDLEAGGSWLGVNRAGHFAAVTNYREHYGNTSAAESRGELVTRYLVGTATPETFSKELDGARFAGFSLLTADERSLWYATNRQHPSRVLAPGVYGLSNAALDTPWHKLTRCRAGLQGLLARGKLDKESLFMLLADTSPAPDDHLDRELPVEFARAVSAPFIRTGDYGTRCTTVVLIGNDGTVSVAERSFDESGAQTGDIEVDFASRNTAP